MLSLRTGWKHTTVKKSTESLVVASKKVELVTHADKTKYMVMSQNQNEGHSYNIKVTIVRWQGWNSSYIWEQP